MLTGRQWLTDWLSDLVKQCHCDSLIVWPGQAVSLWLAGCLTWSSSVIVTRWLSDLVKQRHCDSLVVWPGQAASLWLAGWTASAAERQSCLEPRRRTTTGVLTCRCRRRPGKHAQTSCSLKHAEHMVYTSTAHSAHSFNPTNNLTKTSQ